MKLLKTITITILTNTTLTFEPDHQMLRSLMSLSPYDPNFVTKFLSLRNFKGITAVPKQSPLSTNGRKLTQPSQNQTETNITDKKLTRPLQDQAKTDRTHLREAYRYITDFLKTQTNPTDRAKLNDYGQLKTDSNALWHKVIRELTLDKNLNM